MPTVINGSTGIDRIQSSVIPSLFEKEEKSLPAFVKTGANTLSVRAGTIVAAKTQVLKFNTITAVVMPTLTAGTDYSVYACDDGTVRADISASAPNGYTTANSRKIGGFHYGLVASGTTVAGGSFATTGSGMIWTQSAVDDIAGINAYSIWDLKYRPNTVHTNGMSKVGNTWVDIYLCGTSHHLNGTSKYNTDIASGTVLPFVPTAFGGNGTLKYASLNWYEANEIAMAYNKRLMNPLEFYMAAFGVTESQSIGGAASTFPNTGRSAGYTSRYGIEQATGHHWIWGDGVSGTTPTAWVANGGRGQEYGNSTTRALLGGVRDNAALSGSRCSNWGHVASVSGWSVGLRAACDHLELV
jgi:hypothetical protein